VDLGHRHAIEVADLLAALLQVLAEVNPPEEEPDALQSQSRTGSNNYCAHRIG